MIIIPFYQPQFPKILNTTFSRDWSGWDEENLNAVCFFCEEAFSTPENVYSHMV